MNNVQLVRKAFNFETPPAEAAGLLADDFLSTNEAGTPPLDKRTWIGMGDMMRSSFPDIDYVIEDVREVGDQVQVKGHFVGTFTNDLNLSAMGMGKIPATGKKIRWPSTSSMVSFASGQIKGVHTPASDDPDFFKVLGVKMS